MKEAKFNGNRGISGVLTATEFNLEGTSNIKGKKQAASMFPKKSISEKNGIWKKRQRIAMAEGAVRGGKENNKKKTGAGRKGTRNAAKK